MLWVLPIGGIVWAGLVMEGFLEEAGSAWALEEPEAGGQMENGLRVV